MSNRRTRNRRTAEMHNDHLDIQHSLFDILRFKIPTANICTKTYMDRKNLEGRLAYPEEAV